MIRNEAKNFRRRERRSLGRVSAQLCTEVAEGMGFEPTIRSYPYNGLANRRHRPLGHPSTD